MSEADVRVAVAVEIEAERDRRYPSSLGSLSSAQRHCWTHVANYIRDALPARQREKDSLTEHVGHLLTERAELWQKVYGNGSALSAAEARVETLQRQVEAVRKLHMAYDCTEAGKPEHATCGQREWCYTCGEGYPWPCPTLDALAVAAVPGKPQPTQSTEES